MCHAVSAFILYSSYSALFIWQPFCSLYFQLTNNFPWGVFLFYSYCSIDRMVQLISTSTTTSMISKLDIGAYLLCKWTYNFAYYLSDFRHSIKMFRMVGSSKVYVHRFLHDVIHDLCFSLCRNNLIFTQSQINVFFNDNKSSMS